MFALIDCNNFYVSCERVFQPRLRGKAGVVLSNNDGCAIARSQEAKEMGIKMGAPFFELEKLVNEGKLWWRSSNYTLYQDMMRRVNHIIEEVWPELEIYSIDESFVDLRQFARAQERFDLEQMALTLRQRIHQFTGIPVCIGIGPTKTLAKVANRTAKKLFKHRGVYCMHTEEQRLFALERMPIEDVWGIGPRKAAELIRIGITKAVQFAKINNYEAIQEKFTTPTLRTWYELNGTHSIPMEYNPPDKKGICTGRSFGEKTDDYGQIEDALCSYVQNSAPKLRKSKQLCGLLQVFLHTSQYEVVHKIKSAAYQMAINPPTNLTQELTHYAIQCLKRIYKEGYPYQKVGVYMTGFTKEKPQQLLLHDDSEKRKKMEQLSHLTDKLNAQLGKDFVRFASMGYEQKWKMRQQWLSQRYTTRVEEMLVIHMDTTSSNTTHQHLISI